MENEDAIKELKETADYLKILDLMDDDEKKYELKKYLQIVNCLDKTFSTHRALLLILREYIERGMLSSNFDSDISDSLEEAIYEKSYLNNYKYIIKKMIRKNKYIDVDIIYINVSYLYYINYCRGEYINSLYRVATTKENIETIYKYDNNDILKDLSYSTNKIFKKLYRR